MSSIGWPNVAAMSAARRVRFDANSAAFASTTPVPVNIRPRFEARSRVDSDTLPNFDAISSARLKMTPEES